MAELYTIQDGNVSKGQPGEITSTFPAFETIAQTTLSNANGGTYMIGFAFTWQLSSPSSSAIFDYSVNGSTPEQFSKEPKDASDKNPFTYFFPVNVLEGEEISIEVRASKESAGTTLTVSFADAYVQRLDNV